MLHDLPHQRGKVFVRHEDGFFWSQTLSGAWRFQPEMAKATMLEKDFEFEKGSANSALLTSGEAHWRLVERLKVEVTYADPPAKCLVSRLRRHAAELEDITGDDPSMMNAEIVMLRVAARRIEAWRSAVLSYLQVQVDGMQLHGKLLTPENHEKERLIEARLNVAAKALEDLLSD